MQSIDVYRAKLGAKDPDAVRIQRVCGEAGIRIKTISKVLQPKVGDSAAISVVGKLVSKRGPTVAAKLLGILVRAGRAPVTAAEIAAIEEFFCDEGAGISETAMLGVCKDLGEDGLLKCRTRSTEERMSIRAAILDEYRRLARKRKAA